MKRIKYICMFLLLIGWLFMFSYCDFLAGNNFRIVTSLQENNNLAGSFYSFTINSTVKAGSPHDPEVKIGDITGVRGVRDNQLQGYGIVVGLAGSGDSRQSQATVQTVANLLEKEGINIDSDQLVSRNIAAVMVTANLPPFAGKGTRIDVTVSSLGDARSLQGGTLLMTPLEAANGEVFAVAQGPLTIGGYNVRGIRTEVGENHPTVGSIPGGALVEQEIKYELEQEQVSLLLKQPNFETAAEIVAEINQYFRGEINDFQIARALNNSEVEVEVPGEYQDDVADFISTINKIEVQTYLEAKIVVNEKTGTITMGHNVKLSGVYFMKGDYSVSITSEEIVSHPPPFTGGETVIIEREEIEVIEDDIAVEGIEGEGDVRDLVTALNAVGASARDVISIIKEIYALGALHADLEVK